MSHALLLSLIDHLIIFAAINMFIVAFGASTFTVVVSFALCASICLLII